MQWYTVISSGWGYVKAVSFVLGSNPDNRRIYRHLFCWSSIELALTVVSHIYLTDVLLCSVALKLDLEIEIDFSWLQITTFLFRSLTGYIIIHLSYVHVNSWKCSTSAIDSEMVTENGNCRFPSKMQSVGLKFHQTFLKKLSGVQNS